MTVAAGQRAPEFSARSDQGTSLDLAALRGGWVALFFFSTSLTASAKQAAELDHSLSDFAALSTQVIGISQDTEAKVAQFRERHHLRLTLLPDAGQHIAKRYGVGAPRRWRFFGGTSRQTFLIAPNGCLAQVWRKVPTHGHVSEVLGALRALQTQTH